MIIDELKYHSREQLTTKQCAEAAGINRRTVVEWIRQGILPATRRNGERGHYRILWGEFYRVITTPARVPPRKP